MTQLNWAALYDLVAAHGARPGADLCAVAACDSESGRNPDAEGDGGASLGLWQIHDINGLSREARLDPDQAAAWIVPRFNANYDEGIRRGYSGEQLVRWTCMATERPFGWRGEDDPGLDSPAADRYVASWRAAVAALSAPDTPGLHYDPDVPAERQVSSWACSIRTTAFLLHSIGDWISAEDLQDVMVPGLVTPALGLLQGDGSGLAAFLAAQTGLPTGHAWIDWDWLQAHAGTMPIGIGSPTLYHWVAVRTVLDADTLALANPAPGYQGLGDTMSRAQFEQWQPWACVYIEVPAENGGSDLSVEERAELNDLRSRTASYEHDTFEPLAATMDRILETPKLTKAAIVGQVREMRQSIRSNVGI